MGKRAHPDGTQVEVWREKRGEWIAGEIFGYREADDTYLVQLSGYTAMSPDDPNSWIPASAIRR